MSKSMSQMYVSSGRMGNASWLPLIAFVLSAVVSLAYAYINVYNPFVGYISLVVTAGLVIGVSWPLAWLAKKLKCRSRKIVVVSGILAGGLTLYFAWVCFIYVFFQRFGNPEQQIALIELAKHPSVTWEIIKAINVEGWWSIGSGPVNGSSLSILWLLEALIIVGGCIFGPLFFFTEDIFCEDCHEWCEAHEPIILPCSGEADQLVAISDGGMQTVLELPAVEEETNANYIVIINRCNSCTASSIWQINLRILTKNKNGEFAENVTALTAPYYLDSQGEELLSALKTKAEKAAQDADNRQQPENKGAAMVQEPSHEEPQHQAWR